MEFRHMNNGTSKIPLLGFGCMRLPLLDETPFNIDYEKAKIMVDYALENGLNYFDTAYVYHDGASEAFIGKTLARYPRDTYFIANKMPVWSLKSKKEMSSIFEEQLSRCNTTYFDFYLLHALDAPNFKKAEKLGVYNFLLNRKRAGQIRNLGFSFHDTPDVLEKICSSHSWDFAQIQLNYHDWAAYQSKEQYDILSKHNLPCIIMEPLRGGTLADLGQEGNSLLKHHITNKSIASWALRYAASLPNVITVLSGMSTMAQLIDNVKTFTPFIPLGKEENAVLEKAHSSFCKHFSVPCTGCRYCMPCPVGINIPEIFSSWNFAMLKNDVKKFTSWYKECPPKAKAHSCIRCGHCISRCPQKIQIPDKFTEIELQIRASI